MLSIFFAQEQAFAKTNVYKQVAPNGQIEYSDQPSQESTEMILPQIQVNPPLPESQTNAPALLEASPKKDNQEQLSIRITTPIDQQVFIAVITEVPVVFDVKPQLDPTQKIGLLLDNHPYGEAQSSNAFVLRDLERGAHVVKGVVIDDQNKILVTSAPVTFHQQRNIIKK